MHIYSLKLFNMINDKAILISNTQELSPLPFLMRYSSSTTEMFLFLSRTFIQNTIPGQHNGCKEDQYTGWGYIDNEGMGAVIITDEDYDRRIAFIVLKKAMEIYKKNPDNWAWATIIEDIDINTINKDIHNLILIYKDPSNKDNILKITKELEDTRVTLHKSIDQMLARGEKMDVLVEKSNDLSYQSKKFYKKSKQMNSWCSSCNVM